MNELIMHQNGSYLLNPEAIKKISEWEKLQTAIKTEYESMRTAIKDEMESKGILQIDCPELVISYVAPTQRETFDAKAMRKKYPGIYDDYCKLSPAKSSVRIKVRT